MKGILLVWFFLTSLLLVGCTIVQTANPVLLQIDDPKEICVIESNDSEVNESFMPPFKAALENKGFSVNVLYYKADVNECRLSSTFVAKWSWDFVTYLAHAEIIVYRNGTRIGDALYDAPKAGIALTTKIYDSTESKIEKMIALLFPSK